MSNTKYFIGLVLTLNFYLFGAILVGFSIFKPGGFDPDYFNYVELVNDYSVIQYTDMFLFSLISSFVIAFNSPQLYIFAVYSALGLTLKLNLINRFKYKYLTLLFYFFLNYFMFDIVTIRVSLGLALILWAVYNDYHKSARRWFIVILFASVIHLSLIVLSIYPWFYRFINNNKCYFFILISAPFLGMVLSQTNVLPYILNLTGLSSISRVEQYLLARETVDFRNLSIFSPYVVFVIILTLTVATFFEKNKMVRNETRKYGGLLVFGVMSYYVFINIPDFSLRLSQLCFFMLPFYFSSLLERTRNYPSFFGMTMLFTVIALGLFYFYTFSNEIYDWSLLVKI